MKALLFCEYKKTRRRWLFPAALLLVAAKLFWALRGHYDAFALKNGWMMLLYQLPMINTIFLPLLAMLVSSRLSDLEHKGAMFKQLAAVCDKGKLYDAKLLYGLGLTGLCMMIDLAVTIGFGYASGFAGGAPVGLYLIYVVFTAVPTLTVYCFQYMLAMCFQNQAVTFLTGIIGTFAGLFSMFLPSVWLRRLLPFGHYGALQFVGLFGWTKVERYANATLEIMTVDWGFCLVSAAVAAALYVLGRYLFVKKEW